MTTIMYVFWDLEALLEALRLNQPWAWACETSVDAELQVSSAMSSTCMIDPFLQQHCGSKLATTWGAQHLEHGHDSHQQWDVLIQKKKPIQVCMSFLCMWCAGTVPSSGHGRALCHVTCSICTNTWLSSWWCNSIPMTTMTDHAGNSEARGLSFCELCCCVLTVMAGN
jgi:hypothetical protein